MVSWQLLLHGEDFASLCTSELQLYCLPCLKQNRSVEAALNKYYR